MLYNLEMFNDLKNSIDFFIRCKTKFSRKNFVEKNKALIERNICENAYLKDILEKYFLKTPKPNLKILDIGSKNWFYAKGEHEFFNSFSNDFTLKGVELDAYRLYSNFYSRYEVAKYHIKNLKNTQYLADDLLNIQEKFDYITWFLPFITVKPLVFWGLPKKYFQPEKMLLHAYDLLSEGGQMLIINQGANEAKIQKELLQKLDISFVELGKIESEFFEYKNERFGFLIKK